VGDGVEFHSLKIFYFRADITFDDFANGVVNCGLRAVTTIFWTGLSSRSSPNSLRYLIHANGLSFLILILGVWFVLKFTGNIWSMQYIRIDVTAGFGCPTLIRGLMLR
jgi:hypothetical protein